MRTLNAVLWVAVVLMVAVTAVILLTAWTGRVCAASKPTIIWRASG